MQMKSKTYFTAHAHEYSRPLLKCFKTDSTGLEYYTDGSVHCNILGILTWYYLTNDSPIFSATKK